MLLNIIYVVSYNSHSTLSPQPLHLSKIGLISNLNQWSTDTEGFISNLTQWSTDKGCFQDNLSEVLTKGAPMTTPVKYWQRVLPWQPQWNAHERLSVVVDVLLKIGIMIVVHLAVLILRLGCWVWALACVSERIGCCGKSLSNSTRNLKYFPVYN